MYDLDHFDEFDSEFEFDIDTEAGFDGDFYADEMDDWDWQNTLGTALSTGANLVGNIYKGSGNNTIKKLRKSRGWNAVINGVLGGLSKGGSALIKGPSDEAEPEYEVEDIGQMEAMAEATVMGVDDPAMAADEMSRIAFGPTRADPRMRAAMMAVRSEAARTMAKARRNLQMRTAGRLVPHALRRTAVLMMRMAPRSGVPSSSAARTAFRTILSRMMRDQRLRSTALQRARSYAYRNRRAPSGAMGWR